MNIYELILCVLLLAAIACFCQLVDADFFLGEEGWWVRTENPSKNITHLSIILSIYRRGVFWREKIERGEPKRENGNHEIEHK